MTAFITLNMGTDPEQLTGSGYLYIFVSDNDEWLIKGLSLKQMLIFPTAVFSQAVGETDGATSITETSPAAGEVVPII